MNNNLERRAQKNNESKEQALPSALSSFHSTLLLRLWNTVSREPTSPTGSLCLHYNITFPVITSRTNKISHWAASRLYSWYTLWDVFLVILLGYYWNTCWSFSFRDEMELALRQCRVPLNQCSKADKSDVTQQTRSQQKYDLTTKPQNMELDNKLFSVTLSVGLHPVTYSVAVFKITPCLQ